MREIHRLVLSIALVLLFVIGGGTYVRAEGVELSSESPSEVRALSVRDEEIASKGEATREGRDIKDLEPEIIGENIPQSPGVREVKPVEIASWDDLKAEFSGVGEQTLPMYTTKRLFLKGNNYKLTRDITIDLSDPYFEDKGKAVENGILSYFSYRIEFDESGRQIYVGEDFTFDGGGHTITVKAAPGKSANSLFGCVVGEVVKIENLNLRFDSDVYGHPFADLVYAFKREDINYAKSLGAVKEIGVEVAGDVIPKIQFDRNGNYSLYNSNFGGEFKGSIASGFAIAIHGCHMENIKIAIAGDIGSATPHPLTAEEKEYNQNHNYSSGAFGFLFHAESPSFRRAAEGKETWNELFQKGNYRVLYERGHIENIDLTVGGSILAAGYNNGYSAGLMNDASEMWVNKVKIDVKGDIQTTLAGGHKTLYYGNGSMNPSYAVGFSEGMENFSESELDVENIILDISPEYDDKKTHAQVFGMGGNEGVGYLIRVVDNKVNIRGKLRGKAPIHIFATAGDYNGWTGTGGETGVDWMQFFEGNVITVGEVSLEGSKENTLQYYGLGRQFRTGALENSEHNSYKKPLEQTYADKNTLTVGKLTAKGGQRALIYPSFFVASDVKNNSISYGDIDVHTGTVFFAGLGDLLNNAPSMDNGIKEVTQNNTLTFGNISVVGDDYANVSLMAGEIEGGKTLKGNTLKAKKVSIEAKNAEKSLYVGGLANENGGLIDDSHLFVEEISVKNPNRIYFGLGSALNHWRNGSGQVIPGTMKNSTVFVDNDIALDGGKATFAGIVTGYAQNGVFENVHGQLDGDYIRDIGKTIGGFAGYLTEGEVKNSSVLMIKGYAPFVHTAMGSTLDTVASYSEEGSPKYFTGMLAAGEEAVIKNSTYLVNRVFKDTDLEGNVEVKNNEEAPMYRASHIDESSGNNYVVLVETKDDGNFNRLAHKVEKRTATPDEMGENSIEVYAPEDALAGEIGVAKRSFQDAYWGEGAEAHEMTKEEKNFVYMVDKSPASLDVVPMGTAKDLVAADGTKAGLLNYWNRHAGLKVKNGPIYDLLGIESSIAAVTPDPEPAPKPEGPNYIDLEPVPGKEDRALYRFYMMGDEGKFMPAKGITRAEVAQILARALEYDGYRSVEDQLDYPDVDPESWYFKAVAITTEAGVFIGMDDGTFQPQREITQGELIATLKRFQKLEDSDRNIMNMDPAHWASKEVNAAALEGWLELYRGGIEDFYVDKIITRAEVAAIANRAFDRPVDKAYLDRRDGGAYGLRRYDDVDKTMWSYYEILAASNTYAVDRGDGTWHTHAVIDEGPAMPVEKIKFYDPTENIRLLPMYFQRDVRR